MAGVLAKVLTPRREIPRSLDIGAGLIVAAGILLFWCILTYGGLVDTTFCPPPHKVAQAFFTTLMDGSLLRNAWSSLVVINAGF